MSAPKIQTDQDGLRQVIDPAYVEGIGKGRCALLTAATVLTNADSGKTYFLDLVGGFTVTLPALELGLEFEFIVKTAPTTAYIIDAATDNSIYGTVVASTGGDEDSAAVGDPAGQINFVASTSLRGDRLLLRCDGVVWYGYATVDAAGSVTFTA